MTTAMATASTPMAEHRTCRGYDCSLYSCNDAHVARHDRATHMNSPSPSHDRRAKQSSGFSLIELMIVVCITGILAAIAIPTFSSYIQKSRTSEAVDFLGVIKLRQEAYRAEFGQYFVCGNIRTPTSLSAGSFIPGTAATRKNATAFPFPTNDACFNTIGARPGGPVRFGYAWAAGLPADIGGLPAVYNLAAAPDHFFIAQAVTDLEGDGTTCTYELTSFTRSVWFTPAAGWE
jgi:prepilin-type N-terminal cleavage/methylation domain-containing protein